MARKRKLSKVLSKGCIEMLWSKDLSTVEFALNLLDESNIIIYSNYSSALATAMFNISNNRRIYMSDTPEWRTFKDKFHRVRVNNSVPTMYLF